MENDVLMTWMTQLDRMLAVPPSSLSLSSYMYLTMDIYVSIPIHLAFTTCTDGPEVCEWQSALLPR